MPLIPDHCFHRKNLCTSKVLFENVRLEYYQIFRTKSTCLISGLRLKNGADFVLRDYSDKMKLFSTLVASTAALTSDEQAAFKCRSQTYYQYDRVASQGFINFKLESLFQYFVSQAITGLQHKSLFSVVEELP